MIWRLLLALFACAFLFALLPSAASAQALHAATIEPDKSHPADDERPSGAADLAADEGVLPVLAHARFPIINDAWRVAAAHALDGRKPVPEHRPPIGA